MAKLRSVLPYIFLFILTLLVLDLANPLFDKPARDGGFFLYAGQQILEGKIPYIDFWDSKGPGIFYINALGLWLGGGSRWGVWFVEFAFAFITFLVLYRLLSKKWGAGAALFGVTLASFSLRLALGYGNYTEEYALLFNAIGLYLFIFMLDEERRLTTYLWIGVLFGISFTFRANNIGGFIAILLTEALYSVFKKRWMEAIKVIISSFAGFVLPLLIWVLYFALKHGAGDMIYASILFNISYSAAKERELLDIFGGFGRYGLSWYGWFALFAWFVLVLRALSSFVQKNLSFLETFLLLWFPIEVVLSNLSGRNFTHYYISWILAVGVYSAFAFSETWQLAFKYSSSEGWSDVLGEYIAGALAICLIVLYPSSFSRYGGVLALAGDDSRSNVYKDTVAVYIQEHTQPDDLVLTWYPEMRISYMARRTSPVKYVYYPLFLEGSLTEEIESSYITDLTSKSPELILDCSRSVNAIPSLDPVTREEQYSTPGVKKKMYIQPGMNDIFSFVETNYHNEKIIKDCIVFRLNAE